MEESFSSLTVPSEAVFCNMRNITYALIVTHARFIFLLKLKWPKIGNIYHDLFIYLFYFILFVGGEVGAWSLFKRRKPNNIYVQNLTGKSQTLNQNTRFSWISLTGP